MDIKRVDERENDVTQTYWEKKSSPNCFLPFYLCFMNVCVFLCYCCCFDSSFNSAFKFLSWCFKFGNRDSIRSTIHIITLKLILTRYIGFLSVQKKIQIDTWVCVIGKCVRVVRSCVIVTRLTHTHTLFPLKSTMWKLNHVSKKKIISTALFRNLISFHAQFSSWYFFWFEREISRERSILIVIRKMNYCDDRRKRQKKKRINEIIAFLVFVLHDNRRQIHRVRSMMCVGRQ